MRLRRSRTGTLLPHIYAEAERVFTQEHNLQNALRAHIGYIRATFESRSFSETARYYARLCEQPIVTNDPECISDL
jgi:hypothetical protein